MNNRCSALMLGCIGVVGYWQQPTGKPQGQFANAARLTRAREPSVRTEGPWLQVRRGFPSGFLVTVSSSSLGLDRAGVPRVGMRCTDAPFSGSRPTATRPPQPVRPVTETRAGAFVAGGWTTLALLGPANGPFSGTIKGTVLDSLYVSINGGQGVILPLTGLQDYGFRVPSGNGALVSNGPVAADASSLVAELIAMAPAAAPTRRLRCLFRLAPRVALPMVARTFLRNEVSVAASVTISSVEHYGSRGSTITVQQERTKPLVFGHANLVR